MANKNSSYSYLILPLERLLSRGKFIVLSNGIDCLKESSLGLIKACGGEQLRIRFGG
jgi:hypothetical protein